MENHKYMEEVRVISQEKISQGIFSLWLETEQIAPAARPGQFVSVYCRDESRLLPRPISICESDGRALRLVYRVAGNGTKELSTRAAGDTVRILGPLGNGFPVADMQEKNVLLVGGGIGIPPLLLTARTLRSEAGAIVNAALGYRTGQNEEDLFLTRAFEEAMGCPAYIATEDGSCQTAGNVLDCIRERELSPDVIMACGPTPMLRALQKYAMDNGIPCYLSLEERMACGVGACLACVCKSTQEDAHFGVNRKRVCADGPVFEAGDIVL